MKAPLLARKVLRRKRRVHRRVRKHIRSDRRRRSIAKKDTAIAIALQPELEQPSSYRTYEEGYQEGLYDGGEKWLETHLPGDAIVPDVTLSEVITAGIRVVQARQIPLCGAEQVYGELEQALAQRKPYSLVRLGDGELLTLCQDTVLSAEAIRQAAPFLAYAGVQAPDYSAREELAAVIRRATVVGVPLSRRPHFQPLLFAALRSNGIVPEALRMTSSIVNYALYEQGYLMRLLAGRRVLVIGNAADTLAYALMIAGVQVTGAVMPVNGISDFARVVEEAVSYGFDLALVSAGIAAVPICVHLAERTGRVALDFGHLADRLSGRPMPV